MTILRKAELKDIPGLLELEHQCFPSWDWIEEGEFKKYIKHPKVYLNITFNRGILTGYGLILFLSRKVRLYSLCSIDHSAKQLLKDLELKAKEKNKKLISLEVNINNTKAIRFYETLGYYRSKGILPMFYDNGEDAYVYTKEL